MSSVNRPTVPVPPTMQGLNASDMIDAAIVKVKEPSMRRSHSPRKLVLAAGLAIAAVAGGCAPPEEPSAFIEGVFPLVGPECTAEAASNDFVASALLDIGADGNTTNNLFLPVKVRTNLPSTFSSQQLTQDQSRSPNYPFYGAVDNNVITFNEARVFFTTEEDADGELQFKEKLTPRNENTASVSAVSGVVFNEQTQLLTESVVFATVVSSGDAAKLFQEEFVSGPIQNGDRVRIVANIRIAGKTTGGADVETPPFPFPVDLCGDCLAPPANCGVVGGVAIQPVPNPASCSPGQDVPELICPSP